MPRDWTAQGFVDELPSIALEDLGLAGVDEDGDYFSMDAHFSAAEIIHAVRLKLKRRIGFCPHPLSDRAIRAKLTRQDPKWDSCPCGAVATQLYHCHETNRFVAWTCRRCNLRDRRAYKIGCVR